MTSDIVPVDQEAYKLTVTRLESFSQCKQLPKQAVLHYGCMDCEWRGTSLCAYNFKPSTDFSKIGIGKGRDQTLGICSKRYWWLCSIYDGLKETPTFKEWKNAYNRAITEKVMQNELNQYYKLHDQVNEYQNITDLSKEEKSELRRLRRELDVVRDRIINLGLNHRKIDESVLDREQRSKDLDKATQHLTSTQLHKIMREPIDIDFEEVEVDEQVQGKG